MSKIKVITDSTSDLSPQVAAAYGIEVIPLTIIADGKAYRDGIDITPEEFYPLLASSQELPTTSQVTPGEFIERFESWLNQGYEVLSIHLSRGLSSTVETARAIAQRLGADRIKVVDSKFLSFALAFQAIEAARLAKSDRSMDEIIGAVRSLRERMELLFTLDTLHYLHKGGRIGKVNALLGSLLNIKPLIRVEDGIYVPFAKARSQKQALERMVQFMIEKVGASPVRVAVGHGRAPEAADQLKTMIERSLKVVDDVSLFEVGPVIGVHTGPGTVGVAFYPV